MSFSRPTFGCVLFLIASSLFIGVAEAQKQHLDSARARLSDQTSESSVEIKRLNKRLLDSKGVLAKLLSQNDAEIPESMLNKSHCLAVLPDVLKAAFVIGGEYGKGVLSCRNKEGAWNAPAFIELRAASFGWQIGGKSTDLVIFFVGQKATQLVTTNKFTLGADIGVTAGPVGRKLEGSIGDKLDGVYSYAQSEGIFAGLSLNGAEILPDKESNRTYYRLQEDLNNLVLNQMPLVTLPEAARDFISSLPE